MIKCGVLLPCDFCQNLKARHPDSSTAMSHRHPLLKQVTYTLDDRDRWMRQGELRVHTITLKFLFYYILISRFSFHSSPSPPRLQTWKAARVCDLHTRYSHAAFTVRKRSAVGNPGQHARGNAELWQCATHFSPQMYPTLDSTKRKLPTLPRRHNYCYQSTAQQTSE